jgi:uncharacterized membrane protein
MAQVEKSIRVSVPVQTAYNQWTQFEEFPRFMEGVEEVRQLDDARLFWRADVGGTRKEWYARITEQSPDEVIAWQSEGGTPNAGEVRFEPADDRSTEIHLRLDYEPEDLKEKVGDVLGVLSRRVDGDLARFKEFIEARGQETGAWRGEIHGGTSQATGRYEEDIEPRTTETHVDPDHMRYGASGQGGTGYGGSSGFGNP